MATASDAPAVPTKAAVLQKFESAHRSALHAFANMEQRARVLEARATAAEERLAWMTSSSSDGEGVLNRESTVDVDRLEELMHENERLHAQLAAARVQISDQDRAAVQLKCRVTELETQLERTSRDSAAQQACRQQDENEIKSLRASIRALEKELITSASGYR